MDGLVLRAVLPDRVGLDESRWTLLVHPGARAGLSLVTLGWGDEMFIQGRASRHSPEGSLRARPANVGVVAFPFSANLTDLVNFLTRKAFL